MAKKLNEQLDKPEVKKHPFLISSIDDVLSGEYEDTKQLIGELIYPEEQTVIFGRGNVGKSLLAMQIAVAISNGENLDLGGATFRNECEPMRVVYFDFEHSKKQIHKRFYNMPKAPNLFYANVDRDSALEKSPVDMFLQLKRGAESRNAKCMIIDNLSKISIELSKNNNAQLFMDELFKLVKGDERYTIIIIAHTVKVKAYESLDENHLKGASDINQLLDNLILIDRIKGAKSEAFIKHVKHRNEAKLYDESNVIHTRIVKKDGIIKHDFVGFDTEANLLTNVAFNTEQAPYREICVYAVLYYGSSRKAAEYFLKAEFKIAHTTISDNERKFREKDPTLYNEIVKYDDDKLKALLDSAWHLPKTLELKDGHEPGDEFNGIPF